MAEHSLSSVSPESASNESISWFEYPVRVQPHHTDYGGVVWHGTYITWMESARVECLRAVGYPFERLVTLGYDLPVVNLDIRYRQPLTLGMAAIVKVRWLPVKGIRLNWCYEIVTAGPDPQLCVTGLVTLVTVDGCDRQVVRRLPDEVKSLLKEIETYFDVTRESP
ncbi:MAG: thioesterase family protein [Cyanobacteria bacterium J06623_5]